MNVVDHAKENLASFAAGEAQPDDADLVRRIAQAYRRSIGIHRGPGASIWAAFEPHKAAISEALLSGDLATATQLLRNPASTMFFYGFDNLFRDYLVALRGNAAMRAQERALYLASFVRLAESVGAIRLHNPESGQAPPDVDIDDLLRRIDATMGTRIDFPNPFPGEFGLPSSRGVIGYRPQQAIYQASRLREEIGSVNGGRVLEIGAGLGRTAYFARLLGIEDYTIVDLPITSVAQAYFLGRVLGSDRIGLYGESSTPSAVKIMPPEWLFSTHETFDIALNVDSLTEMDRTIAERYVAVARNRCSVLLSINHEVNLFTVRELLAAAGLPHTRHPYWMRGGYVEESARFA